MISTFTTIYSILPNIVEDETCFDWSGVRSPGRARRRLKQGHKQNIKPSTREDKTNNTIYVHPEIMKKIRFRVSNYMEQKLTENLITGLYK